MLEFAPGGYLIENRQIDASGWGFWPALMCACTNFYLHLIYRQKGPTINDVNPFFLTFDQAVSFSQQGRNGFEFFEE